MAWLRLGLYRRTLTTQTPGLIRSQQEQTDSPNFFPQEGLTSACTMAGKRFGKDPLARRTSSTTPSSISSTPSSHGFQRMTSQPSSSSAPFTGHGREPVLGVATVRQLPHFHGRSWLSLASSSDGYACHDPRPASQLPQGTDNGSSMMRTSLLDHQYGVHFPILQQER